jgi:hypothetical protein
MDPMGKLMANLAVSYDFIHKRQDEDEISTDLRSGRVQLPWVAQWLAL